MSCGRTRCRFEKQALERQIKQLEREQDQMIRRLRWCYDNTIGRLPTDIRPFVAWMKDIDEELER